MAASLLDSLRDILTPELVGRIGSALDEPSGAVTKGLGAVVPALLGGVAEKARDPGALQQIFSLVTDPANDGSALRDPTSLLGALAGGGGGSSLASLASRFLPFLFGNRTDAIVTAIANYAGIQSSSAQSLLRLGAPLVLGLLGDRVRREGLGAPALGSLLAGQRDTLQRAIPGALAGILGPAPARPPEARAVGAPPPEPARRGIGWLLPAVIGLGLLAAIWSVMRGNESRVAERAPTVATPPVGAAPPSIGVRRTLPDGSFITAPETSFESELVAYLTDASRPLGDTWLNLDRILFETDSASLKESSREQLANVAKILKAYPSVHVKIGGYTDNTGDPAHNVELSRARANSVRDALLSYGVPADRLEAEGYGQDHPVASNDTEAGRTQNRRIAMRVTAR